MPPRTGVEVRLPSSKEMLGLLRNCEGLKGMLLTGVTFWGVVRRDSFCSIRDRRDLLVGEGCFLLPRLRMGGVERRDEFREEKEPLCALLVLMLWVVVELVVTADVVERGGTEEMMEDIGHEFTVDVEVEDEDGADEEEQEEDVATLQADTAFGVESSWITSCFILTGLHVSNSKAPMSSSALKTSIPRSGFRGERDPNSSKYFRGEMMPRSW